jgi:hypothetical protein
MHELWATSNEDVDAHAAKEVDQTLALLRATYKPGMPCDVKDIRRDTNSPLNSKPNQKKNAFSTSVTSGKKPKKKQHMQRKCVVRAKKLDAHQAVVGARAACRAHDLMQMLRHLGILGAAGQWTTVMDEVSMALLVHSNAVTDSQTRQAVRGMFFSARKLMKDRLTGSLEFTDNVRALIVAACRARQSHAVGCALFAGAQYLLNDRQSHLLPRSFTDLRDRLSHLVRSHKPDLKRILKVFFFYQLRFDVLHLWNLFPALAQHGHQAAEALTTSEPQKPLLHVLLFVEQVLLLGRSSKSTRLPTRDNPDAVHARSVEEEEKEEWRQLMEAEVQLATTRRNKRTKEGGAQAVAWRVRDLVSSGEEGGGPLSKDAQRFLREMSKLLGTRDVLVSDVQELMRQKFFVRRHVELQKKRSWFEMQDGERHARADDEHKPCKRHFCSTSEAVKRLANTNMWTSCLDK